MVGSRVVTDAESRYAPIESEITALTWALRKARKFLIGAPKFKVYTDHRPLVSLVNSKRYDEVANSRILRNLLKCRDFDLDVEYIKGSHNVMADSLSRNPVAQPEIEDIEDGRRTSYHVGVVKSASIEDSKMTIHEEESFKAGNADAEYCSLREQIREGFTNSKNDLAEC